MHRILLVGVDHSTAERVGLEVIKTEVVSTMGGRDALRLLATQSFSGAVVSTETQDLTASEVVRRTRELLRLVDLPMEIVDGIHIQTLKDSAERVLESATTVTDTPSPAQRKWRVLLDQFRRLSAGRLMDIKLAEEALEQRDPPHAVVEAAIRSAHNIAGSAAMFGHAGATDLARSLEDLLKSNDDQAFKRRTVPELLSRLESELGLVPSALVPESSEETETAPDTHTNPSMQISTAAVMLVEYDEALIASINMVAGPQGVNMLIATSVDQARAHLRTQRPDVAIVDLTFPNGESFGLLEWFQHQVPPVPVVALTNNGNLDQRLQAARHGVERLLQKPMAPAEILSTATQLVSYAQESRATVMVVDDDPLILTAVENVLQPLSVRLVPCPDPSQFLRLMEETRPELVLLDISLGDVNGLDLCRVLRNDRTYQSTPVIILTTRNNEETLSAAFAAGADDFIGKPIFDAELLVRVKGRIERNRLMRQLAETDPLTGAFNRRKFTEMVSRYLRLSDRQNLPLSLGIIDIDRFKQVNDTYGHLIGDAVLQRLSAILRNHLRGEDVVARWGGEEFAVVLFGSNKQGAAQRLTALMNHFHNDPSLETFRPTFSGGVAEYPRDGKNLVELQKVADAYLYQAKAAGRARIFAAGQAVRELQKVDVVLIDDDEVVVAMVQSSLEERGLTVKAFSDPIAARDALLGDSPGYEANVVLLDVTMPGMDGLTLLSQFKESGLLQTSRVILLTARAAEADMAEGLQAGAFDYVAKPFSTAVLVERVRRAIEG